MNLRSASSSATRLFAIALATAIPWNTAFAQTAQRVDFTLLTLEELMEIPITSAARRVQRPEDVAAAVHVITQEDIRGAGVTELAEVLRLVPGVQVARVNGSEWAVSVRGFNSLYSDKLLVLIDGRSIYNRGFSGVFWDGQNVMLSDVERIEVIRGPGGTAGGANAVNGVINIITKSAADTRGTVVEAGAESLEHSAAAVRHGGVLGPLEYRVYSRWSDHRPGLTSAGLSAHDGRRALTTGARMDWSGRSQTFMAQGSYMNATARPHWSRLTSFTEPPITDGTSDLQERVLQARWTHRRADGSELQLQASRSDVHRDETTLFADEETTDVDVQYQTRVRRRHDVVTGSGFRASSLSTRGTFTLDIPSDSARVYSAFLQDEIALGSAVQLTVGSRLEHDTFAGWGLLPSARVMWKIDPSRHRAWGAVSRARRTPAAAYRAIRIYHAAIPGEDGVPIVFGLTGNPDYRSEELVQLDAGYRLRLGGTASIEVAAFRGKYSHSTTVEPLMPTFETMPTPHVLVNLQFDNLLNVVTHGAEVSGRWSPAPAWQFDASYSTIHFTPRLHDTSLDPTAAQFDGNAPRHQWQVHSTTLISPRVQLDGGLYYVGRLKQLGVPSYVRADVRLALNLSRTLSAIAVGHNLVRASHWEFSDLNAGLTGSSVPRSAGVQLRWQF